MRKSRFFVYPGNQSQAVDSIADYAIPIFTEDKALKLKTLIEENFEKTANINLNKKALNEIKIQDLSRDA